MVISTKFGELVRGWNLGDIRGSYDTSLWKDIRKYWLTFSQNVAFSLGDNRKLSFSKDTWCGEVALCIAFPTLVAHKDVKVAEVCDYSRVERGWSPSFLRSFNDWGWMRWKGFSFISTEGKSGLSKRISC